jgi:hypothetical protein
MRSEEESETARSNTETRYRVLFAGNEIGVWRDPEPPSSPSLLLPANLLFFAAI